MNRQVLDLFSAAAGGWSLGMHRAGYRTLAACEWIAWRRALYAENNPGVLLYADVRDLTAARLLADTGTLPDFVVGSPPCQDISSANTKGKGVEGSRSGLYFEAIRIVGEIRRLGRERGTGGARWVAFENSANLRTRGADAILPAMAAEGYTCWTFVVGACDIGANHERRRSWIIGVDLEQLTAAHVDAARIGHEGRGARRRRAEGDRSPSAAGCDGGAGEAPGGALAGQADIPQAHGQAARARGAGWAIADLADHIRMDDGISAGLAGARIDIGDGQGDSAAGLLVEAFGDAVVPQIPEAIGRAIDRVERAFAAALG